jgi:hypothetical protein
LDDDDSSPCFGIFLLLVVGKNSVIFSWTPFEFGDVEDVSFSLDLEVGFFFLFESFSSCKFNSFRGLKLFPNRFYIKLRSPKAEK